jgi:N-acetylglutamate synthase-like GNAT family acetyltransferase
MGMQNIEQSFKEFIICINQKKEGGCGGLECDKIGKMGAMSKLKIKVIQGIIQIDCPINYSLKHNEN